MTNTLRALRAFQEHIVLLDQKRLRSTLGSLRATPGVPGELECPVFNLACEYEL